MLRCTWLQWAFKVPTVPAELAPVRIKQRLNFSRLLLHILSGLNPPLIKSCLAARNVCLSRSRNVYISFCLNYCIFLLAAFIWLLSGCKSLQLYSQSAGMWRCFPWRITHLHVRKCELGGCRGLSVSTYFRKYPYFKILFTRGFQTCWAGMPTLYYTHTSLSAMPCAKLPDLHTWELCNTNTVSPDTVQGRQYNCGQWLVSWSQHTV